MHADRRLLRVLTPAAAPALRWNHDWAIARAIEGLEPYVRERAKVEAELKTPATKALEQAKVTFTTHTYAHDPKHESYGLEAAEALGLDPATVFKTLVADVDGKLTVAIVPRRAPARPQGAGARRSTARRRRWPTSRHAERTTGYVAGGISPLGQKKRLPTVLDDSALALATIHVSGGRRGLEIELAPADLRR